ncbi:MAG: SUMF1/EgtB/PvdO family nonheme iron enzyme [Chthoniobacteraceae bacterium]
MKSALLSSKRGFNRLDFTANNVGFRVVLAPATPPLPPAVATATATKDEPFVNGLGMKFVPVPITGGPTDKQRVLFSVWDTRVRDYNAFAQESKREWPTTDFEQEATHPAVNVSWEDATAFCAWLTERERKTGRLAANESYRLPTDHEWSCAVGIGEREDGAKLPNEKNQKIPVVYPWGSAWPPPERAGNYWSEELRPLLAARKYPWITAEIAGRRDGYATTAPVGSFAPNLFGLYDTGGNAWEWCEDWFDAEQQDRVLRGASWQNNDKANLLSSFRTHHAPIYRNDSTGFRCVLAGSVP